MGVIYEVKKSTQCMVCCYGNPRKLTSRSYLKILILMYVNVRGMCVLCGGPLQVRGGRAFTHGQLQSAQGALGIHVPMCHPCDIPSVSATFILWSTAPGLIIHDVIGWKRGCPKSASTLKVTCPLFWGVTLGRAVRCNSGEVVSWWEPSQNVAWNELLYEAGKLWLIFPLVGFLHLFP